jgi:hypothetical protein
MRVTRYDVPLVFILRRDVFPTTVQSVLGDFIYFAQGRMEWLRGCA